MISDIKYRPIDCSFHDILLDRATRKKKVKIEYLSSDKQKVVIEAIIIDVFTKGKEEFMKLNTKELVRLDYIISVDGLPLFSNPK